MTVEPDAELRPRKERKANADMRRMQLLDATLRSIASNGLGKTTLATVANEAGLSQGVAVFYFKSKTGLLTEALREHYSRYRDNWKNQLEDVGDDPLDQLIALILADFADPVCNAEALAIWFAFWGEQRFTPQYAVVSAAFDCERSAAIREACARLLAGAPQDEINQIADWIDTLSDGYWQRLHVLPETITREMALTATLQAVARLLPSHASRILNAKRA